MQKSNKFNLYLSACLVKRLAYFVVLTSFLLLLSACGKGGSSAPAIEEELKITEPQIVSVLPLNASLTIDLNLSGTINFDVITRFDDETETTATYTATWDAENQILSITDSDALPVAVEYDVDALINSASNNGSLLTITDDLLPENITINFTLIPVEEVVVDEEKISSISLAFSSDAFIVGDVFSLGISAKAGDKLVANALQYLKCSTDANSVISISANCTKITALSAGEANVVVSLIDDASVKASIKVTAIATNIQSLEPQLLGALYVGDLEKLSVKAIKLDGTKADIDLSLLSCSVVENDPVVEIVDNCKIKLIGAGDTQVSISLLADPNISQTLSVSALAVEVTELKVLYHKSKITMGLPNSFSLSVKFNNGGLVTGAEAFKFAKCAASSSSADNVLVEAACVVTGQVLGAAEVTAELLAPQSSSPVITAFPFEVVDLLTLPVIESLTLSGGTVFTHQFQVDVPGTYKIKLNSDSGPLDRLFEFFVTTGTGLLNQSCSNIPAFNDTDKAIPGFYESSVACGVDTTDTSGEINVFIFVSPEWVGDFTGTLELINDEDILTNDNQGVIFPASIDDYFPLLADSSPHNGHVSSNSFPGAANQSRYHVNTIDGGLLTNAQAYQVRVKFLPDSDGKYHFALNSVRVGWNFDGGIAPVVFNLTNDCAPEGIDTIVCNIASGLSDLFVFVYGNDQEGVIISPATADGELSYTVEIINVM